MAILAFEGGEIKLDGESHRNYIQGKENSMKISDVKGLEVEQLVSQQTDKVNGAQAQTPAENSSGEVDVIHLSSQSRLMQKASEVVYQTPEVRSEKVSALQESVQGGTYEVDSLKVANRLITEIIQEK
jgi:negative regulator of flagellin synthesis FlgM